MSTFPTGESKISSRLPQLLSHNFQRVISCSRDPCFWGRQTNSNSEGKANDPHLRHLHLGCGSENSDGTSHGMSSQYHTVPIQLLFV